MPPGRRGLEAARTHPSALQFDGDLQDHDPPPLRGAGAGFDSPSRNWFVADANAPGHQNRGCCRFWLMTDHLSHDPLDHDRTLETLVHGLAEALANEGIHVGRPSRAKPRAVDVVLRNPWVEVMLPAGDTVFVEPTDVGIELAVLLDVFVKAPADRAAEADELARSIVSGDLAEPVRRAGFERHPGPVLRLEPDPRGGASLTQKWKQVCASNEAAASVIASLVETTLSVETDLDSAD